MKFVGNKMAVNKVQYHDMKLRSVTLHSKIQTGKDDKVNKESTLKVLRLVLVNICLRKQSSWVFIDILNLNFSLKHFQKF